MRRLRVEAGVRLPVRHRHERLQSLEQHVHEHEAHDVARIRRRVLPNDQAAERMPDEHVRPGDLRRARATRTLSPGMLGDRLRRRYPPISRTDCRGRFERAATGENRQRLEEPLLAGCQEIIAPVD